MDLTTIECNIIKRLKTSELFQGMDIDVFPVNFEEYNFTSSYGCVLIKYNGEDLSEPEELAMVEQTDTYSYIVYLGLRSMNDLSEAYPLIKEIKDLLTGYKINKCKLYPSSIKHVGKVNYNDHYWAITFKFKMPNVSRFEENNIIKFYSNPLGYAEGSN